MSERYSRQIILPELGLSGQKKLADAKVLVVGSGGLGGPIISYLAAAGIGTLGIMDGDVIGLSNLHRQVLFTTEEIGLSKAGVARLKALAINPEITVVAIPHHLCFENVITTISDYDVIIDGTDNFYAKYLINDACVLSGKSLIAGSILRFEGNVSVFNFLRSDGTRGPNYRDLFPEAPTEEVLDCASAGVIGPLAGIIGSIQAAECIKLIVGMHGILDGSYLHYDLINHKMLTFKLPKSYKGSYLDPPFFDFLLNQYNCYNIKNKNNRMKEISVQEVKNWLDEKKEFQFIDVREPHEYEMANLGAELMPLAGIPNFLDKIRRDVPVVIHCRSGFRSGSAVDYIESQLGIENLYNMEGGILAYARDIDPSLMVS